MPAHAHGFGPVSGPASESLQGRKPRPGAVGYGDFAARPGGRDRARRGTAARCSDRDARKPGPLGAQADAGSVSQPEPTSFGLSGRNLQPLASPDPLDPLVIDHPACRRAQQRGDLAIAVAAIAADQFDDVGDKLLLIVASVRDAALGRAVLPQHTADPPLRHLQSKPDMVNAGTATRGAYQFPEAASFRISLSSVRSATARRSRAFSASSSFSRFT